MPGQPDQSHCIVVADSEVLIRDTIAEYLRGCGYKVIEAASSEEVVTILEHSSSEIRVVLADAELGGTINAFQLRLWLRDHYANVDIVLAGNVDAAAKAAGELCDKGPHLKRPYDTQAVVAHIRRLIAASNR